MAPVEMLSPRKNRLCEYVEKSVIKVKAVSFDSSAHIRLLYEKRDDGATTSPPPSAAKYRDEGHERVHCTRVRLPIFAGTPRTSAYHL